MKQQSPHYRLTSESNKGSDVLLCVNHSIIPKHPHWAIIHYVQVSANNTRAFYYAVGNQEDWKKEISMFVSQKHDFVAMYVKPATVDVQVRIGVEIAE